MRLLLVEDDKKISAFLEKGLSQAGYDVDTTGDGESADSFLKTNVYDLLILDIMLPKMDGLTLVENFRKTNLQTPVLFLSAKRSVDDRIKGFQSGGDDYLTKPFSFEELLARVQALLRRTSIADLSVTTTLVAGDIRVDLVTREVRRCDQKIELQLKEFALLEFFLRNSGQILSKSQILERIWNYQFDPQTNVVDVLVFRLRTKIERDFDKKLIHTIRGVGYVFKPD